MDIDYCSAEGARRLAERIIAYWRARGYAGIEASVEPINNLAGYTTPSKRVYAVFTNIGPDGFPPPFAN